MALKMKDKAKAKNKFDDSYLATISFLQATGLVIYCLLIGSLLWRGNEFFGPMNSFLGPMLFLIVFVVSVLVCALLAFGYPVVLFWDRKKTKESVKLVAYTTTWLLLYVLLFLLFLIWPVL